MKFMLNRKAYCLVAFCLGFLVPLTGIADDLYFPSSDDEWETVSPESIGWDVGALDEALALAGELRSSGVVILHNGRILAERYWDAPRDPAYRRMVTGYDDDGHSIEDVASVQKSVVAVLTGMAQSRGFLSIHDSVGSYLDSGWSQATVEQEREITIRHLLSMTSGLDTEFRYAAEAGTTWLYNTPVYHSLMQVIEAATGLERNALTVDWIGSPLGLENTSWTPRPWADSANSVGLSTTARELARFGLMVQSGGMWGDQVVMDDPEFIEAMLSPSQTLNSAYGYLWWINGQEESVIDAAPADLVAMQGALDRKLYLVPSLNLVVARLGHVAPSEQNFNELFWAELMRAAPAR